MVTPRIVNKRNYFSDHKKTRQATKNEFALKNGILASSVSLTLLCQFCGYTLYHNE